jgi:DNA-binding transcriptional LysR family regulator
MDRFEAMTVLLKVVEAGSLSAASRQLGIPLATVSRKITELEAHLKTRVLIRSSRRLSLTETGSVFVEASRRILEQLEEAERAAMGEYSEPKGYLTITAPIVFGRTHVLPIIAEFLREYPKIDIKLRLSDLPLNLFEGHIDVAVRIGELSDSSLVATRIGTIRRVTCVSPGYLAAHGRPLKPEDLREHECVTFDNLASSEAWRFITSKGDTLVPVHTRLTVTTAEAAIDGAVAGIGFTRLLSYHVAEPKRAGKLEVVLGDFEIPAWPVHLIYPTQHMLPRKLRAFLNFATPRLRARLVEETALFESA